MQCNDTYDEIVTSLVQDIQTLAMRVHREFGVHKICNDSVQINITFAVRCTLNLM